MSQRPQDGHATGGADGETRPTPTAAAPDNEYGQYGAPQYGPPQYGPPQYGPPPGAPQAGAPQNQYGQYGAPEVGGYYGPGFAQVPAAMQPGIIPLRPLTLGEVYDGAFRAIRSNPGVMFGLSALVVAISTVIELVLVGAYLADLEDFLLSGSTDLSGILNVGSFAGVLLASVVTGFATVVLTGLLILSVSESVLGRTVSIADVWRRARGQVWRLLALTLLIWVVGTALAVAGVLALALLVAGVMAVSAEATVVVVLAVLGLLFLLALALAFLGVRTMLAPPAIMLERSGVLASIARSWRLTKGHFWRLFGIMVLTLVLLAILQGILTVPFSLIGAFAGPGETTWPLVLSVLGQAVGSAVAIPFVGAVLALLYIDVRMRTEALDVELARAAQGS